MRALYTCILSWTYVFDATPFPTGNAFVHCDGVLLFLLTGRRYPRRLITIHWPQTTYICQLGDNKLGPPQTPERLESGFQPPRRKPMPLSPSTSATSVSSKSSFFSADTSVTVMQAEGMSIEDLDEYAPGQQHNNTQGSDECEATQPVWSQTQEATQPQGSSQTRKKTPLSETCYAILVPAAPNIGLSVLELRRDHPEPYRVGRNASRTDFLLPSKKVSSVHARIWMQPHSGQSFSPDSTVPDEGSIIIEDCSSNGVYVEGTKLGKGHKTALTSGTEISFGPPSTAIDEDYSQ